MTGGGEGGNGTRQTNWSLILAVASLVLAASQFWAGLNDKSEEKAVALENRLTAIECKLRMGVCGEGGK